jgi:hypothetical protein
VIQSGIPGLFEFSFGRSFPWLSINRRHTGRGAHLGLSAESGIIAADLPIEGEKT